MLRVFPDHLILVYREESVLLEKYIYLMMCCFSYILKNKLYTNKKEFLFYLRLEVHRINSLRPGGGVFFNNNKSACKVRLEYLGPIGP